ncbi:hypothetical protein NE237_022892 [Protea cynaroides]|uniref:Ubiquitin-like domain-containing protein n=1 Tax=Protea cynaroides TaxID=273540 RepID=A0A9Q0HB88_9MAGN|nr:hypothetical protein NE237_022892 [Protea cynaroides]
MLISIETEYTIFHELRGVSPSTTVLELKQRMERKSGAKAAQQVLWFERIKLKDEKTIDYYGLRDGMELYMIYNYLQTGIMTILAKTETKTYNLAVQHTDTVLDLKGRIYRVSSIPVEVMTLFYREIELENNKPLLAYFICDGSMIRIAGDQNVTDHD